MKKLLLALLVMVTTAALFPKEATAGVGIKGGLNFATYKYSGPNEFWDFCNSNGPIVGVFFSLGQGPVAIQPEIFYSRRGAKQEIDVDDYLLYRSDFIEVPVLVKWSIVTGQLSPVVFAGPYGAYNVSHKAIEKIDGETETIDIREGHSKTDYGLVFGGGLEYKLETVRLILEGRYTLGMRNVEYQSETESYKNRGISVLIGVGF